MILRAMAADLAPTADPLRAKTEPPEGVASRTSPGAPPAKALTGGWLSQHSGYFIEQVEPLLLQRLKPFVTRRFDFGLDAVDRPVHHMVPFGQLGKMRIR
jgi:hypothetical protein